MPPTFKRERQQCLPWLPLRQHERFKRGLVKRMQNIDKDAGIPCCLRSVVIASGFLLDRTVVAKQWVATH